MKQARAILITLLAVAATGCGQITTTYGDATDDLDRVGIELQGACEPGVVHRYHIERTNLYGRHGRAGTAHFRVNWSGVGGEDVSVVLSRGRSLLVDLRVQAPSDQTYAAFALHGVGDLEVEVTCPAAGSPRYFGVIDLAP